MKTIRFGIIGCGLMGREFASAAARWAHLTEMSVRPEIVAVCNRFEKPMAWFSENFASIRQTTTDYRQLLANRDVDAVYIALPHNLHREVYVAAIEAGKHLLGEKPFGIDLPACEAIAACSARHPHVFVRCSSEFPFFPAVQQIGRMIVREEFGRIIEVNAGFLHCSDLDPLKPINWKRMTEFNGEYGCMGDLGMHVCHIPFRAGWMPRNVRAVLTKVFSQRPDGKGSQVPCRTWDNATLLCDVNRAGGGFPMTLKTHRIAPGQKNTWYLEIYGTAASARFTTANPKALDVLEYKGGNSQIWQQQQIGYESAFKTITGPNFEFGFTDAILQMWASFCHELAGNTPPSPFAALPTVQDALASHRLFMAALRSQTDSSVVPVE